METLYKIRLLPILIFFGIWACEQPQKTTESETENPVETQSGLPIADPDNGAITLPNEFGATVVADTLGRARHLVVNENGDIYVKLRKLNEAGHGIIRLRDTNGDGKADEQMSFGKYVGTGIEISNGYLYASSDSEVFRYSLANEITTETQPDTIVTGLLNEGTHEAKSLALDGKGNLFVNIGAPSNACQVDDRQKDSPGQDPCPLLKTSGGVWKFGANKTGQTQADDGVLFSTGIRNAVALDWNPVTQNLYALQHGRDQLNQLFEDMYTQEQSAELPSEEFLLLTEGSNFGWPYCYYDHIQNKRVLGPEFGGDGNTTGKCEGMDSPIFAFPGHWAPNDVLFYTGDQFPERYKNGAFIAFHGSWNRAPLPQAGYTVVFLPFNGDKPSGSYEVFANDFAGEDVSPRGATYRPMGLAQGADGSLYIADSQKGRVWRVMHYGDA